MERYHAGPIAQDCTDPINSFILRIRHPQVWTPSGLTTYYVLFVISLVDRAVHVAGITTRPDEPWMLQVVRNLVDEEGGALASKRYRIIDRDTKYSERFRGILDGAGVEVIRLPPMSPNLKAYASDCLLC